jgi:hypothetical protein
MGQQIRSVQFPYLPWCFPFWFPASSSICFWKLPLRLKSQEDNNIPYQMYIKTEKRFVLKAYTILSEGYIETE